MPRLAWATDIHLNAASPAAREALLAALERAEPDAVLLGGDIGEADSVEGYLVLVAERLARPVYFVLGNHDAYGGRIAEVRVLMRRLSERSRWARWLPAVGVVALSERLALVGHDGWSDGRLGMGEASRLIMNDHLVIADFTEPLAQATQGLGLGVDAWLEHFWRLQPERFTRLRALGDEAADYVRSTVPAALARFEHVVFLTHPPPFREACWHQGKISGDDWLPHLVCHAVGEALREAAAAHPGRRLTVLCGHTHGAGEAQILPNLRVLTGAATYGRPEVQAPLTLA